LLVAMSFTASYIAVDNGFDESRKQSAEFLAINAKIEILSDQVKRVTDQVNALPLNYITKREQLSNQIISIENNIASLIDSRVSLKTDSLASKFGKYIAIAAALIIELLTVSTTIAISLLSAPNKVEQSGTSQDGNGTVTPVLSIISEPNPEPTQLVFAAKTDVSEQIRNAVLTRSIERPSVACIRKSFNGIASDKISSILKELGAIGHLEPRGANGWKYA